MAKKTSIKVRLVPESKPDSPFFYYVKKPSSGEKAKVKLKVKKYNPATRKHEIFVEKGQKINQGDIIGTVGSTGRATGPHLDVRLNWFGTRLDPATVIN